MDSFTSLSMWHLESIVKLKCCVWTVEGNLKHRQKPCCPEPSVHNWYKNNFSRFELQQIQQKCCLYLNYYLWQFFDLQPVIVKPLFIKHKKLQRMSDSKYSHWTRKASAATVVDCFTHRYDDMICWGKGVHCFALGKSPRSQEQDSIHSCWMLFIFVTKLRYMDYSHELFPFLQRTRPSVSTLSTHIASVNASVQRCEF